MEIIYDIHDWKEEAVVATIGFFDGVHSGHRFLLQEMRNPAKERNLPSAVITFPEHPRVVLHSDYQPKLLNSFDEKIDLLSKTDIDYIIVMDFTPELAALTAREFITDILSCRWRVGTLLIGYDHRFGYQRAEGFEQYVIYGRERGMEVIKASSYSDEWMAVSSSTIRCLIENGDMATASYLLGYNYRLKGHVVGGRQVGRLMGFPTANIAVDEKFKVVPRNGSYAVWIVVDGKKYKGMLYIGSRPTIASDDSLSIEVNIFDFSGNIYDEPIIVEFVDFIREDVKFDSLDKLKEQMEADKQYALSKLTDQAASG
ncbi:MAG: riboflavin biosynthesis protein RibF [Tannerella sp.]|jgi:riboflavin kinase/FMN adenylyltransferase|nr:riboflavin biosynthesis protein RibF [Tannerella sp.]